MMLSRPSASPEALVRQALRLGLLGIGLGSEQGRSARIPGVPSRIRTSRRRGDHDRDRRTIPEASVQALLKEAAGIKNPEVASGLARRLDPRGEELPPHRLHVGRGGNGSFLGQGQSSPGRPGVRSGPHGPLREDEHSRPCQADAAPDAEALIAQARTAFDRRDPAAFHPRCKP